MTIRILLSIIIFSLIPAYISAVPLQYYISHLSAEQQETLLAKKELVVYSEGLPEFRLIPPVSLSGIIKEEFDDFEPNVNDEALFLLPKVTNENPLEYIHNRLRNIETLSGIQYQSNHYREQRILFENVFRVEEPGDKESIAMNPVMSPPPEQRIFIHLEDVNFGSSYYEAVYFNSETETSFGLKNITSLRYRMVPLITKENVRFQMVIIPTDEYLLVYGVCGVKAGSLIRKMIHLPSSFYTRMKALRNWFNNQIY